jgi:RecB family endonuclease NucS
MKMVHSIQDRHACNSMSLYAFAQRRPYTDMAEINILRDTFETYKDEYPFIDGYEYKTPTGVGDLRLTDGKGRFVIFEAKRLRYHVGGENATENRRQKKRYAESQAIRYLDDLKKDDSKEVREAVAYVVWNESDGSMIYSQIDSYKKGI